MAPRRKEPEIGNAPMIGNGRSRALPSENSNAQDNMPSMHSTINADKFDNARFSEMRDMENESNPLRIILFVIIVIAIGGGGVLFFRNLISNDQTSNDTTDEQEEEVDTTPQSSYIVDKTAIRDSQAVNKPENSEYEEAALKKIGESTDTSSDLSRILYTRFQTFARLTFDFTADDKKLPKTTINFESSLNRMTLSFEGVTTIASGLKMDETISDIVKEIRYSATDNSYVVLFTEKTKYVAAKDGDNLILNFKTADEIANPTVEETPAEEEEEEVDTTPETDTDTTTGGSDDSGRPTTNTYDNEYSQKKQYIVSSKTANDVSHNVYYFDNYVNSYEFSWAQKNAIGNSTVPNAEAYYDSSAPTGKVYLIVEISNLSQDVLTANGVEKLTTTDIQNKTGVNTSGSNLVSVELLSFSGGVAKYRLELNEKTDYKLWVDKTVDNTTGTISVTVKN